MHTPQTRAYLEQCRAALADADVSDELRALADNLLNNLLDMHAARRLRAPMFLLALDSLELVPGLEGYVTALRESVHLDSD